MTADSWSITKLRDDFEAPAHPIKMTHGFLHQSFSSQSMVGRSFFRSDLPKVVEEPLEYDLYGRDLVWRGKRRGG
jgi:hypothetical protein